jgi:hypothetical protein
MIIFLCSGTNDLLKIFWIYESFLKKNFVTLPTKYKYGKTIVHVGVPFGLCGVSDGST